MFAQSLRRRVPAAAAAASVISFEEKQQPPQLGPRVIFPGQALPSTPSSVGASTTSMVASSLQGVCEDAIALGGDLALDPRVQEAVLARMQSSPEWGGIMEKYGLSLDLEGITQTTKELKLELEFQQQMTSEVLDHGCARIQELERQNKELAQRLEVAEGRAQSVQEEQEEQEDQEEQAEQEEDSEVEGPEEAVALEQFHEDHACEHRGYRVDDGSGERAAGPCDQEEEEAKPTSKSMLLQTALGVAAMVVALVVMKRVPQPAVVKSMLAAVAGVFATSFAPGN